MVTNIIIIKNIHIDPVVEILSCEICVFPPNVKFKMKGVQRRAHSGCAPRPEKLSARSCAHSRCVYLPARALATRI
jgi:hypothetical protein